jgi:tetratricopeptide (TPR) repeat protein
MKSLFIFFGSISVTILLLAGCGKQTLATKPYHNLTGRYNAYYNANLRVEESFSTLNKQHQDNYNKLLHMYPYAAAADVNSVKQPLDEAITKSARNIKLHEIGNWTDDSYHLMGKAEFLQQEYERAANTFKFIVDKYHPENVAKELEKLKKKKKKKKRKGKKRKKRKKKKRKKKSTKKKGKKKPNGDPEEEEEEKPIKYGLKHRPVRYKSMLWLAKTYIELGQYDDAGYYLRQLENDMKVPKKLRSEVQAVIAYNWITQKEYAKAVEPLEAAIKGTKKKTVKNRYVYVLGQIYQMQSNNQMAMENFHDVLRLRPSYAMEFNARLNMATNAASASGKKAVDPEIALKRMLRDSKNDEYKDQIYFALAKIKLKSGKTDEGILALQQSLNYSASNAQRAEGALLLAELFYEKDDFVRSYAYYDSTVQVMDKEDERYTTTEMYKRRLEGVATHVAIKVDKDSMLIVGAFDRKKQEAWAIRGMEMDELNGQNDGATAAVSTVKAGRSGRGVIDRERQGMKSVDEAALPSRSNKRTTTANGKITISDAEIQKSKFPLYNASLKKKGEREFEKRWNNRAWVDDWRRSDREEDVNTVEADIVVVEPKTQAEIDAYLKKRGVPRSDQEIASTKAKVGEAMYKAAEHYREDLGRTDKALKLVEELVRKYPENTYAVEGMFLAYNIYSEKNNISKATYYKNEILKKYPESNIAKVLSDPEFANSEKLKYEKINKYYDDTYAMIQGGEAEKALGRVRAIPTEFGNNYEMKARFAILEAMCVGGMKGEQDYIKALRIIVTSFPDTKEETQAKKMIAILSGKKGNRGGGSNAKNGSSDEEKDIYKVNKKMKHFILIVFDNAKTRVNQYRAPLTQYNNKFHLNKKLSVSTILVDRTIPTLIVRGAYPNADEAMKYVVDARSNKEFLPGATGYTIYAISSENYGIAMTTQKFRLYSTFFETHYR